MGLGIVEPKGLSNTTDVLGTSLLEVVNATQSATQGLKTAKNNPDIVLAPQPSDDPADPLNWPALKKNLAFACLCYITTLAGVIGPVLAPAFVALVPVWGQPLSRVSWINVSLVLTIGFGSWIFGALAIKFGQRPTLLLAIIISLISCVWAAVSGKNFNSLLAARAVQGLGMGALFNNPPSIIQDMFFVHERGFKLGLWNLCLIGGINIGPVISAQIFSAQGWQWTFWWLVVAYAIGLIGSFFLVPESIYNRQIQQIPTVTDKTEDPEKYDIASLGGSQLPAKTYLSSLKIYNGTKTSTNLLLILLRPFYHITSPSVILGCIVFSVSFNWLPLAASTYAQIFTSAPFFFSTSAVGLIGGIPPLIGTIIGTFASGPFSDWFVKQAAKRNNGVFEAEFRLILLAAFAVFGGIGAYGWGIAADRLMGWRVISVFIAILHVGISAGTIGIVGYVSECAGDQAADAVGFVVLVKSIIGMGILQIVNDWYASAGPKMYFVGLGSLTVAVSACAIPFWFFGKIFRVWAGKHAIGRRQTQQ